MVSILKGIDNNLSQMIKLSIINISTNCLAVTVLIFFVYVGPDAVVPQMLTTSHAQNHMEQSAWLTGTSMKVPRTEGASAVASDKIYIIGGSDKDQTHVDTVEVYDVVKDKWTTTAPLPAPVYHTGSDSYDGKIYVVGGLDLKKQPTDTLFIYDPLNDKWENGQPLPSPLGALTAEFINGTLYAVGGINSSHIAVGANFAYDLKSNRWSEKAPMPTARHHLSSAVVDDKLYAIGGRILGNGIESHINPALSNLNTNEMYNPLNDSWSTMAQMPTKRSGLASVTFPIDDNIYVFGGQSVDGSYDTTEKYNSKLDIWTREQPMPTTRLGLQAETIGNKIYVIGGKEGSPGRTATGVNEIFEPIKK